MNKTTAYRAAAFSAPIVCLLLAVGLSAYETVRIHKVNDQTAVVDKDNAATNMLIADIEKRGSSTIVAVAPDSRDEQGDFVNSMRAEAARQQVRLTQWSVGTVTPITPPATADPKLVALIKQVSPLSNQVGVSGTFAHLRSFLKALLNQDRYLSLSAVKWSRAAAPPDTAITFTVTRYVSTALVAAPHPLAAK